VEAARANVRAARLEREISIAEADATRPLPLEGLDHGLLVTNPPYGDRLAEGGQKGMKTFYFHLGERLGGLHGFRMAVLSGNPAFETAFHHRPLRRRPLWNGAIECTLLEYPARASG
jgi:putative N6-adenine-specific DNA methylase